MSELRQKWLHQVVIIRDGSSEDGQYGLVTQIIPGSQSPLTVTFWIGQGVRHENYYAPEDLEPTDQAWNDYLGRDSQLRCIYDKHFTHLYYICGRGGRDINGYGTPGLTWAHWFEDDEATIALHRLVQGAQNDTSTTSACSMESRMESDTNGGGEENEG
jgi:hypothetical protein